MLRLALHTLTAHKRRVLGIAVATVLGVAFLAGTLALGDTLQANFASLFADANAGTDVVVRNATELTADGGAGPDIRQRGPVPADLVAVVRSVEGVAGAEGVIDAYGQLLGANGKAIGGNGPPRTASSWVADPRLDPYRLVEGRAPAADGEVVINRGAARDGNLHVGSRTIVQTPQPMPVTVVGIATFGSADGFGASTYVAFAPATAARLLTQDPTSVSRIVVRAAPGVSQDQLAARVQAAVPAGIEAVTGKVVTQEDTDQLSGQFLTALRAFLVIFAGIALLVAAISIHNAFSVLVAQRRRDAALLRAIGATRRQVLGSVVLEGAIIGLIASVAGVGAGIGLAGLLKGLFDAFGFALPAGGLVLKGTTVAIALVVGVLATVVAALLPARHAARTPPVEALRAAAVDHVEARGARAVGGTIVLALGIAAVIGGAAAASLPLVGFGALGGVIGLLVAAPALAGPAVGVLAWPFARTRGVSGQLAQRNARRNPRRTAASAAALVVGVGIAVVFSVLAASIKAGTGGELERAITADVVVAAPSFGGGGLSPKLAQDIAVLNGVAASTAVSRGVAVMAGTTTELTAADGPALAAVLDLEVTAGSLGGVDAGHVAVSRSLAQRRGWSVGSTVAVQFADGTAWRPTIAAIYRSTTVASDVVVPRSVWAAHTAQLIDRLVLVQARAGTDVAALRAAIAGAAAPFGAPTVEDAARYATSVAGRIDLVLGIVDVLLALAVLIALMGIATTASLAVHERRREVGLLRAVGQTARQARAMVRIETTVVALYGTLVGTVLGLFVGWGLVAAIGSGSVRFSLPIVQLAIVVVAGAVAGALAGRRPARRAAQADVLSAIAT